jgi:hypothetical protein
MKLTQPIEAHSTPLTALIHSRSLRARQTLLHHGARHLNRFHSPKHSIADRQARRATLAAYSRSLGTGQWAHVHPATQCATSSTSTTYAWATTQDARQVRQNELLNSGAWTAGELSVGPHRLPPQEGRP